MGASVPGYEASAVTGIGVPKNTPAEVIDTLNKAINAAFADPTMKARLADTGGAALPGSPADFEKLIAGEIEKWGRVIKVSGTKPNSSRTRSSRTSCSKSDRELRVQKGH